MIDLNGLFYIIDLCGTTETSSCRQDSSRRCQNESFKFDAKHKTAVFPQNIPGMNNTLPRVS